MKKFNKDKRIELSIIGVLIIVAVIVGIKLYKTTMPEKQDDQIELTVESDVLVDYLELEEHAVIEEVIEETELNITILETEEVRSIEENDKAVMLEDSEDTSTQNETVEGKTLVVVNEEEPEIPEVPTVANEEALADSSKEPEYEEEPVVEENQAVEGDVVQVETETKDEKDIPEGVNTIPAEDSENPFLNLGPPPSGDIEGVDASEYSEDGKYEMGGGDKF